MFDTGSQRTYITNSLKSRLGLKPIERESLRLSTFGNDRVRKESCDTVKLSLRKGDGESVDIAALSFPVVCSSLPLQVDVSAYPHIKGLPLADEFNGQEHDSIDVLIGSDQCWNFITGETVRRDFGPTALSSKPRLVAVWSYQWCDNEFGRHVHDKSNYIRRIWKAHF